MYFDIVCSVYEKTPNGSSLRIDSYLMSGGYETEAAAKDDMPNYTADIKGSPLIYAYIEIEAHNDDGSLAYIIENEEGDDEK